jgi:aspartyl-tRNA(Asn)/glutamyl-tRNA(Gln) amidotransferase subunit C
MKKKLTTAEVAHVAKLANLELTPSQLKKYTKQLSEVIDYNMVLLEKVDAKGVGPTAHVSGSSNILQPDEVEPGLTSDEALQNAKETHSGFFKVKAIFEKD